MRRKPHHLAASYLTVSITQFRVAITGQKDVRSASRHEAKLRIINSDVKRVNVRRDWAVCKAGEEFVDKNGGLCGRTLFMHVRYL